VFSVSLFLVDPSGCGRSLESASSSVVRNGMLKQISFLISDSAGLYALVLRASVYDGIDVLVNIPDRVCDLSMLHG
jgi:hypothetical protein